MKLLIITTLVAFAAALILGGIDRNSAEITVKNEKLAAEKKADVKPEEQVWLMLPLECRTWIAKCGAGQVCKRRYTCSADLEKRAAQ